MHFSTLVSTLATLLATNVAADRMEAATHCHGTKCDADQSIFVVTKTNSTWAINANGGCRRTAMIPDMSICVDWVEARAHYWFKEHKRAEKFCIRRGEIKPYLGCHADRCEKSVWEQVECEWDTSTGV
jgi:hypothetical protein